MKKLLFYTFLLCTAANGFGGEQELKNLCAWAEKLQLLKKQILRKAHFEYFPTKNGRYNTARKRIKRTQYSSYPFLFSLKINEKELKAARLKYRILGLEKAQKVAQEKETFLKEKLAFIQREEAFIKREEALIKREEALSQREAFLSAKIVKNKSKRLADLEARRYSYLSDIEQMREQEMRIATSDSQRASIEAKTQQKIQRITNILLEQRNGIDRVYEQLEQKTIES